MNEIEQLKERIAKLEFVLNAIVYPDRYEFMRTLKHAGPKLGLFGVDPVKQHTAHGVTGFMTTDGGASVTEANHFYGNAAYYNGGNGTKFTIGDIITTLKDYGLLPK